MPPETNAVAPGAAGACTPAAPSFPLGAFSLQGILERNAKYIIPTAWRELGAAEALSRLRALRIENLRERKEKLERAAKDPIFREEEMARCAEDLVYWLTFYGWMYNSDARQSIPFLPLEIQVTEVLYPFYWGQYTPLDPDNPEADRRNHMYEKPRKVGVTWCILAAGSWGLCFHHRWPGRDKNTPYVGGVAADVKEHVKDRENPESHLGRVEQILRSLPLWMLPGPIRPLDDEEEPAKKKRLKGDTFGENKISFPENKAFLVAKAAGRNVGRSVRFSWFLLDEEEFAEKAGAAVRSIMDATSCFYRVSSVNGTNNSFSRDFNNVRLKVNRHRIRYWHVPWYDDAWLKAMSDGRSDEDFRREILCERNVASGKLYWAPPWSEAVNVVKAPIPFLKDQTLWIGIDVGKADGLALIYLQRNPLLETVDCHGMVYRKNATLEWMIPFILGEFPKTNRTGDLMPEQEAWHPLDRAFVERVKAMRAVAPFVRIVVGSDAAEERMHADSCIVQSRRMWGITMIPVKLKDKLEAIDAVKWMVPYLRIEEKVNAMTPGQHDGGDESPFTFNDVFYGYRKQVNRQTEEVLPSGRPVHDRVSNPADALQYLVHEMPRVMKRTTVEVERMNKAREAKALDERRKSSASTLFRRSFGRPIDA